MSNDGSAHVANRLAVSKAEIVTVERLDEQLTAWAELLKTELALYPDGARIWNRTKFDMFGKWQQEKLSIGVQKLFEHLRDLKNAYSSIGAGEHRKKRLKSMSELSDSFVSKVLASRGYKEPPERPRDDLFPQAHGTAYVPREAAPSTKQKTVGKPRKGSISSASLGKEFDSAISRIKAALAREVAGQTVWNYLVSVRFKLQPHQMAKVSPALRTRIQELQRVRKKYEVHRLGSEYEARLSRLAPARGMAPRTTLERDSNEINRSKGSPPKNSKGIDGYSGGKGYYSGRRYYWNEE